MSGGFLVPSKAKADVLIDANSQNMGLLQANVSSMTILEDKKNEAVNEKLEEIKDFNILSNGALLASTGPQGIYDGVDSENISSDEISVYVVRKGDSIALIAQMFKVSTNTILWANDLKKGDKLVEGDVLIILPVDGVNHIVAKGDTLKKIADKYKVEVSDITSFNEITIETELTIGSELVIPGAEISVPVIAKSSSGKNITQTPNLKNISGYFINPVPNYKRRSQGLHDGGIDLAAPTGTPIIASASGTVLIARNGSNGGYGNMIILQHPNGTRTLYAHLSRLGTHTGAKVSQGETIGYVGSTGRSTGPHLHFEVKGAKNPGATTPMSFATR